MKKTQLLQLINRRKKTKESFPSQVLCSYINQLGENTEASYKSFTLYLHNNLLRIAPFFREEKTENDIFQKLINSADVILENIPLETNKNWEEEKWLKDWKNPECFYKNIKRNVFENSTILHIAARVGDLEFLKYLVLQHGADINIRSYFGGSYHASTTPFIELVRSKLNGSVKHIETYLLTMIELGANIYFQDSLSGKTAADYASDHHKENWVRVLLKYGLKFNEITYKQHTHHTIKNLFLQAQAADALLIKNTDTAAFKAIEMTLYSQFPTDLIKIIHSYNFLPLYGYFTQSKTQLLFEEKPIIKNSASIDILQGISI